MEKFFKIKEPGETNFVVKTSYAAIVKLVDVVRAARPIGENSGLSVDDFAFVDGLVREAEELALADGMDIYDFLYESLTGEKPDDTIRNSPDMRRC